MDFSQMLHTRRAINFFDTQKDISDEELKGIITDAANTPSSFNLQPWNIIVLRELDDKMRLRKLAMNQEKITEAPVILIFLADRDGWKADHPIVERNFTEMVATGAMSVEQKDWFIGACSSLYGRSPEAQQAFALKNTGFFAMSVMYAATARGLHTHPMDGFDHDAVMQEFGIPKNFWVPLALAIGHLRDGEALLPPKWRKKFDEIVVRFDSFNPS